MPRFDASRTLILALFLVASGFLYTQLSDRCADEERRVETSPRIAVISMTTQETSYDHIAISNKYEYAQRHGYQMVFDYRGKKGVWDKLTNIENVIRTNKYDWIWWLDYDILITNQTVKIEHIIDEALGSVKNPENIDMIVTPDCFPLNAGSMIYRSTPWVLELFKKVWACGAVEHIDPDSKEKRSYSEQDCIRDMIADNTHNAREKSVFVKQWKMNAFPEEIGCFDADKRGWERGMFALHFAGAWAHVKHTDDPVGYLMRKYNPYVVS